MELAGHGELDAIPHFEIRTRLHHPVLMKDGIATLWDAQEVFTGQDANLVQQFNAQVEAVYTEILAQIDREDADLAALSKQYQHARSRDYFDSPLGERVRRALIQRREGTEE